MIRTSTEIEITQQEGRTLISGVELRLQDLTGLSSGSIVNDCVILLWEGEELPTHIQYRDCIIYAPGMRLDPNLNMSSCIVNGSNTLPGRHGTNLYRPATPP